MEEQIQALQTQIPDLVKTGILDDLQARIGQLNAFVRSVRDLEDRFFAGLDPEKAGHLHTGKAGGELEAALQNVVEEFRLSVAESPTFADMFPQWDDSLTSVLESLPETVTIDQTPERFDALPGDSLTIKLGKASKRFKRGRKSLAIKTANVFRRSKKVPGPWPQHVPFRDLAQYHLGLKMIPEAAAARRDLETAVFNRIIRLRDHLRIIEAEVIAEGGPVPQRDAAFWDEIEQEIAEFTPKLQTRMAEAAEKQLAHCRGDLRKGGTLELSSRKIKGMISADETDRAIRKAGATVNPWTTSEHALLSEWHSQAGLALIQMELLHVAAKQHSSIGVRLEKRILPLLTEAKSLMASMILEAENCSRKKADLERVFTELGKGVKQTLQQKCIDPLSDTLLAQNFPMIIEKVEHYPLTSLPDKKTRWTNVGPVKESESILRTRIEQIGVREILDYEFLPPFSKSMQVIQSNLVQAIAQFRNQGTEVVQIVDYNLQTGLAVIEEGETSPETAYESVVTGLHRASDNLAGLETAITETLDTARNHTSAAALELSKSLQRLKDPQSVASIRSGLLKAKAIQRSKDLRQKAWNYLRFAIPMLWTWIKSKANWVQREAEQISNKLGLAKTSSVITSQVSDFLAESETAISQLPLVYQRLFRPEAVTDDLLFVPRDITFPKLQKSYENWQLDRYTPTVLVGEPGAGRSSLLLKWLAINRKPNVKAIAIEPEARIFSEKELCELISANLELPSCSETDSLIEAINAMPVNRIVVMEDLEMYFLKHIGGFAAIRSLMRIISETNKKVYWLFSASTYSWDYLDKTLTFSDAIGYVIELEGFTDAEIKEIVMKRHRLSGFKIDFVASELDLKNQTFRRASEENRPELLKNTYFSDLNRLADSNLSIAFLFWMRSALSIEEFTLKVGSLKDLDFSFMDQLPASKAIALHQLLLHNGLTAAELAKTLGITEGGARSILLLLLDDGILVRQKNAYRINPLLYRHSIRMLKKRNFIH